MPEARLWDIEAMLRRAGLSLSPEQIGPVLEGWALVGPMLDVIRRRAIHDHQGSPGPVSREASRGECPGGDDAF